MSVGANLGARPGVVTDDGLMAAGRKLFGDVVVYGARTVYHQNVHEPLYQI